ncbi:putative sensor with CHASE2 domain protein [Nostoc sp. NIES-4103]|nr:putative sensor with CHASE2 domain protein [Nostoc sp. NIES-4103]
MVLPSRRKIRQEINIWRQAALPGIIVLFVVIIARLTGLLQVFEWTALDALLRFRSAEPTDDKVVIIGINEQDIRSIGRYPIPDNEIASLIKKIQNYQPTVIGIDIVRDIPIQPGHEELIKIFQQYKNIIGIEKVLPPDEILPPPQLPPEQIAFSDIVADKDGKYRRYLLWTKNPKNENEGKYSLALRLSQKYLSTKGIDIENGKDDRETIRFANTELPRFLSNSGGYVGENDTGIKTLINFHSGSQPFLLLSLNDIKTGNFNTKIIQEKIVLIGVTAISITDFVNTSATVKPKISGQIYGVEFQAHATSQIINAVLNNRPMLKVWSERYEYLWIIFWGLISIMIGRLTQAVWKNLLAVVVTVFCLSSIAYLLLLSGYWIPLAPSLLILVINGLGLSAFAFYEHDKAQKHKTDERQYTIEYTFTVIHNGPLQTLANTLRQIRTQDIPNEQLILQLEKLNYEIRAIGEYLRLETLTQDESLRLGSGVKIDLKRPIHELFYEVYTSTLARNDLEYFNNINIKVRTFDPIEDHYLSLENKQELCLFLEEALCNVGKHAKGVKRIEAIGKQEHNLYTLMIKDNGCGLTSSYENKSTKQLRNTAKNLGGYFKRESLNSKGTICEISWNLGSNRKRN